MSPKTSEVTLRLLRSALARRVEVVAFGLAYRGRLKKVSHQLGTIEIVDKKDRAVLEIERIESFKIL